MFFENEFTGSLTFLRLLFGVLMGLAPIAVTIIVKRLLYRRRLAEDKASAASESRGIPGSNSALENFAIALANEINKSATFRRHSQLPGLTSSRS